MDIMDQAQAYFDAWNNHDPRAVVNTFEEEGWYEDPTTNGKLKGEPIGKMVEGLIKGTPDLNFEVTRKEKISDSLMMAEWLMKGTAQGQQYVLEGIDVITGGENKLKSVKGYFDSVGVQRTMGLQIITQPKEFPFPGGKGYLGTSMRLSFDENKGIPKAISLTYITPNKVGSDYVDQASNKIVGELMRMDGFLGGMFPVNGDRAYTVTLWDSEEGPRGLMKDGEHKMAASEFFSKDITEHAMTSVFVPSKIKQWVKCASCGKMEDYYRNDGKSTCGEGLPSPKSLF